MILFQMYKGACCVEQTYRGKCSLALATNKQTKENPDIYLSLKDRKVTVL